MDTELQKQLSAKLFALFAIGTVSFLCGIAPFYMVRTCRHRFPASTVHKVTAAVICFSGGSLLGVTFLHLMPEVREKIENLQNSQNALPFPESLPLSDIIAMSGFFGVYMLDEFMHLLVEWYSVRSRRRYGHSDEEESDAKLELGEHRSGLTRVVCSQLPQEVSAFSLDKHENSRHQISVSRRSNHHATQPMSCICASDIAEVLPVSSQGSLPPLPPPDVHHCDVTPKHTPHTPCSGLVTIAALSFHEIFEGLAVGVEPDITSILFLYLSIASHKYAISFCIGLDLVLSGSRIRLIVWSMLTFSIVTPLGVIIGMIVAHSGETKVHDIDVPLIVVLQGLAGGTLIYVVCFEVLQREGTDTHTKGIINVLFVVLGFLVCLALKVIFAGAHVHHTPPTCP